MMKSFCTCCGTEKSQYQRNIDRTWWQLSNYHGLSGLFCPKCYDKVSHNSFGEPDRPADYLLVCLKLAA